MNLVIYGKGKIFNQIESKIDWKSVVAIVDQKAEEKQMFHNHIPIFKPEKLVKTDYDYIIICSDKYFRSIKRELVGTYFVDENKIMSWHVYDEMPFVFSDMVHDFLQKYIGEKQIDKILDVGLNCGGISGFIGRIDAANRHVKTDGLGETKFPSFRNYFFNIYSNSAQIKEKYDAIILPYNYSEFITDNEIRRIKCDSIVYISPYRFDSVDEINSLREIAQKKLAQKILLKNALICIYENIEDDRNADCKMYVVSHKKYNLLSSDLYIPICVGENPWNNSFLSECCGENIVRYNDRINECTALYWIWKNTESEIVGINHYRRYFYNNSIEYSANYLSKNRICEILEDEAYDIILPNLLTLNVSVYENIRITVGDELVKKAYDLIRSLLLEKQPDYVDAFDYVLTGNKMYPCNMFVARREVMNEYCKWLFSFIIDAAELLDVSECDYLRKRTIGYFAETMMTCWTLMRLLRIYELPITNVWLD